MEGSRPTNAEELVSEVMKARGQLRGLEGFSADEYSVLKGTGAYFTDGFGTAAGYGENTTAGKSTIFLALINPKHGNVETHLKPKTNSSEKWYLAHSQEIEKKFEVCKRPYTIDSDWTNPKRGPDPLDRPEDLGKIIPTDSVIATHVITVKITEDAVVEIAKACRLRQ